MRCGGKKKEKGDKSSKVRQQEEARLKPMSSKMVLNYGAVFDLKAILDPNSYVLYHEIHILWTFLFLYRWS